MFTHPVPFFITSINMSGYGVVIMMTKMYTITYTIIRNHTPSSVRETIVDYLKKSRPKTLKININNNPMVPKITFLFTRLAFSSPNITNNASTYGCKESDDTKLYTD